MERLAFAYGRTPILAGLDLSVAAGTITGVLGPNGSGKTTLVRLASAALRPSAGRITLFGKDLASLPDRERAQSVALGHSGGQKAGGGIGANDCPAFAALNAFSE
jgi:ABC-type cobalamin/Fe3+-siderophores transport system ATPase subunit